MPRVPDRLDSSEDEAEKDAKRPHPTSTTPKSSKGLQPDECDRLMGIGSVQPSGEDGDGKGELTHIPKTQQEESLTTQYLELTLVMVLTAGCGYRKS